jgi:single-strand DNA-binding protein
MDHRNLVVLTGRLTADPELRYLPSGAPVANFSVAVNRSSRKKDGTFEDILEGYFDCEVFDNLAIALAESLPKGAKVQLTGSLLQKRYENSAGQSVSKIAIRVRSIARVLAAAKVKQGAGNGQAQVAQPA